jgi:dTDP-4-dehydrorhamnose 3,5-epimerase
MDQLMIDGISLTTLKRIPNEKGDILHALKQSENSFTSFGEAYFSIANYQAVKGWKMHTKMTLNLIVPIGAIRFVIFDNRSDSSTHGIYNQVVLSADNYSRLTIQPGLWVAFQGVGKNENMLLNIASIEHDPAESINSPLEAFEFNWHL